MATIMGIIALIVTAIMVITQAPAQNATIVVWIT
jgi:hypothetical protein